MRYSLTTLIAACLIALLAVPALGAEQTSAQPEKIDPDCYKLEGAACDTSADNPTVKLLRLMLHQELEVASDKASLIHGDYSIMLIKGIWGDIEVAAYNKQAEGLHPTVLPFTRYQPDEEAEADENGNRPAVEGVQPFSEGDPNEVYFLYVTMPADEEARTEFGEKMATMLSEEFQEKLSNQGFIPLPERYYRVWRVSLGLQEARFPFGYE